MKARSKNLDITKTMPPLHHTVPGEEFDIEKSEVVKWLVGQPEILNYVINRIKGGKGQSPYIVYNSGTETWQGVDYHGD